MKNIIAVMAAIGFGLVFAHVVPSALADNTKNRCSGWTTALSGSDLSSDRSFTMEIGERGQLYKIAAFRVKHTDSANGSVTEITINLDDVDESDSDHEYDVTSTDVSAGVGTTTKATNVYSLPGGDGSESYVTRMNVSNYDVVKATISASAGTGHADDDLKVMYNLCVD